jgi:hypothetical protein
MPYTIFTVVRDSKGELGSLQKKVNTFREVLSALEVVLRISEEHSAEIVSTNIKSTK